MPVLPRTKSNILIPFEKPDLNQLIEENSLPMRLNALISQLDFSEFYNKFSETGAPNYPPEEMMSIIMLAFSEGVFSTRKIEEKCKRDVYYMFITEQRKPDHSTIARFIQKNKEAILKLSVQIVQMARDKKIASFSSISLDGSKIASLSSKRHSKKSKELDWHVKYLEKRMAKILEKIEQTDKQETAVIKKLEAEEKRLQNRKAKAEKAKIELVERQKGIKDKEHRENHQINIEEQDARMMPVIETNGYNVQISVDTSTGIIASQRVTVSRSDNNEFEAQHKKTEEILGSDTSRIYIADSGYNSNETLEYIEKSKTDAYINDARIKNKPPTVEELEDKGKKLTVYDFVFDKDKNEYLCPNRKRLVEIKPMTYECEACDGCKLQKLCCEAKGRRRITKSNYTLKREAMNRKVAKDKEKMNQRKTVERVFGQMKWNLGFRKFHRKGQEGAEVEMSILAMAINMLKIFTIFRHFSATSHLLNWIVGGFNLIWWRLRNLIPVLVSADLIT